MIKKLKITFLLTIIFGVGMCTHSFARIKTNDPTVTSGGTVTITISSQEPVASGAIKITSNDGLTFKSASGGTVNGDLVAFAKTNNETSGIATYTFAAPEVSEDKTYKVVFSSQDMADENGNPIESSSATATVTVKKVASSSNGNEGNTGTSSTNEKATMTKVQVGDKTYTTSGFTVKVENDVTSIKVVPTISNGESYTINGETSNTVKLEEGTNTINIKLASGNTYKIYVRRAAKVDDTPNIIDDETTNQEEEEKVLLKSLLVKGVTLEGEEIELFLTPEFSSEIYEYIILLDETMADIVKLEIEGIANDKDYTVQIEGNEELQDGENEIIITVKSKDGKTTAIYKILVIKEETMPISATTEEEPNQEENGFFTKDTLKIIIVAFTSGVAILGIIFAVIEYRYGKDEMETDFEEEDILGEIAFPGINFEKEPKEENQEIEETIMQEQKYEQEYEQPRRKTKSKGKHF